MDTGNTGNGEVEAGSAEPRLSEIFAQLARDSDGPVSVAALRDAFGDRSLAALVILFSLLNVIPLPPGATAVTGLPLLIVSVQMLWGGNRAWLPRLLTERAIPLSTFRLIVGWTGPRLVWLERWISPRRWPFGNHGHRIVGLIVAIMAIFIILPIPFGNQPPAIASALLGLALMERDGILFGIGVAAAIASAAIVALVIGAVIVALQAVWNWVF